MMAANRKQSNNKLAVTVKQHDIEVINFDLLKIKKRS